MKPKNRKFRRIATGLLLIAAAAIVVSPATYAMLDPAACYCDALGYEYLRGLTSKGEQALCGLPDGAIVDAWEFLRGRVGLEWSYCAIKGYEARHVESSAACRDCTVCVLPDGTEQEVTELMGLDLRETRCGDGSCGTSEDQTNCPEDCPAGGVDEYCSDVSDGVCDPDCVEAGEDDPDCPAVLIDILPGSCVNPFNTRSKGLLPVAILGTEDFNVQTVDPDSIRLKRQDCIECTSVPLAHWSYENVKSTYLTPRGRCRRTLPDEHLDLVIHVSRRDLTRRLLLDDVSGQVISLTVKGYALAAFGDAPFRGSDSLRVK